MNKYQLDEVVRSRHTGIKFQINKVIKSVQPFVPYVYELKDIGTGTVLRGYAEEGELLSIKIVEDSTVQVDGEEGVEMFVGTVVGFKDEFIQVMDCEDNVYDCDKKNVELWCD